MVRLLGYSFAGVKPKDMRLGPVPASRQLLSEAFAAQALAAAKELKIPMENAT